MKILVVDDTQANRLLLQALLQAHGYEVALADNGVDALAKLRAEPMDMIVSDVMMPLMDGYQLCRECKRDPGLEKIPFVFVTSAYLGDQDEKFAFKLGAARYIRRPIEGAAFVAILQEVIREQLAGESATAPTLPREDAPYFEEYSARVVLKLEEKVKELEATALQRERAIAERAASEQRFRALVEQASDFVATLDAQGRIQYVSPAVTRVLGYEPKELVGGGFFDFAHPDDVARTREDLEHVVRERATVVRTGRYRHKDGSLRSVQTSARSCLDDPAVGGVIINARDVTESEQALEMVRASELRYRSLFESTQDGILLLVDDGTGQIRDANPYMATLLGSWHDDLVGAKLWEIGLLEDEQACANTLAMLRERGSLRLGTSLLTSRTGRSIDIEVAAHLYDADGTRCVQFIVRDVTERVRSERVLMQRAAMEHLVSSLSTRLVSASVAELDSEIRAALRELTTFAGADWSSLYLRTRDGGQMVRTHDWHATDVEPVTELGTIDFARATWLAEQLGSRRITYIAGRAVLPPEAETERELVGRLGVHSFLCVPMVYAEALYGFVAIASANQGTTMDEADMVLLGTIADVFSNTLARRMSERVLERTNRALRVLSASNAAAVHAGDEAMLLSEVCRVVVEVGGYRGARVYQANEESGVPTLLASRGEGDQEPALPDFSRVLELPLSDDEHSLGTLCVDAELGAEFEEAEVQLLRELAYDVSFGLITLRTREERDRVTRDRRLSEIKLRSSLEESIQAIAATLEMRDPYTAGHQRRVAILCTAIARRLGLAEERIHGLRLAATIHDLGKIQIPSDILNRPGRLSPIEFELIKRHPQIGHDIMKDVQLPWNIAEMIWQHHEHLDGSGYPQGLKGSQLSLESRILTVADVAEAMASHRPYRAALGVPAAIGELEQHRGTYYDPDAVDACVEILKKKGLPGEAQLRALEKAEESERTFVSLAPLALDVGE